MDNIDLFDRYISGNLTAEEKAAFDNQLAADTDFATDFRLYKTTVRGVIKEEIERKRELEEAFKHLNEEGLMEIIGKKKNQEILPKKERKVISMTSWISSVAAIMIIAFSVTYSITQSANENVDSVLFECYYNPVSRSASGGVNLSEASSQELQRALPTLVQEYNKASEEQAISEQGINLAMIYVKLHDRKKAKEILVDVKHKCSGNVQIQKQCDKLLEKIR